MPPRLFIADQALAAIGAAPFALPAAAARHVQVLRLQPGDALRLFDGRGGEWQAQVAAIGRNAVQVALGAHVEVERELALAVTVALGMPANERMDTLVEKATELGVARLQPLLCERSVLRLTGDRAQRKVEHWQRIAAAAAEQSGRTRVPEVAPVRSLPEWLASLASPAADRQARWLLAPGAAQAWQATSAAGCAHALALSGPEGGLTPNEQAQAQAAGFEPRSLGPRVLRADTAPLAVLAALSLHAAADDPSRGG